MCFRARSINSSRLMSMCLIIARSIKFVRNFWAWDLKDCWVGYCSLVFRTISRSVVRKGRVLQEESGSFSCRSWTGLPREKPGSNRLAGSAGAQSHPRAVIRLYHGPLEACRRESAAGQDESEGGGRLSRVGLWLSGVLVGLGRRVQW